MERLIYIGKTAAAAAVAAAVAVKKEQSEDKATNNEKHMFCKKYVLFKIPLHYKIYESLSATCFMVN